MNSSTTGNMVLPSNVLPAKILYDNGNPDWVTGKPIKTCSDCDLYLLNRS